MPENALRGKLDMTNSSSVNEKDTPIADTNSNIKTLTPLPTIIPTYIPTTLSASDNESQQPLPSDVKVSFTSVNDLIPKIVSTLKVEPLINTIQSQTSPQTTVTKPASSYTLSSSTIPSSIPVISRTSSRLTSSSNVKFVSSNPQQSDISLFNEGSTSGVDVQVTFSYTGSGNYIPSATATPGLSANATDSTSAMKVSTGGITALVFLGLFLTGVILLGWKHIVSCCGLRRKKRSEGISNDIIGFDGHGMPRSTSWFLGAGDIKNMSKEARRRTKLRGRGITPSMFLQVPELEANIDEEKGFYESDDNKAGIGSFEKTASPTQPDKPQKKRTSYLMQQGNPTRPLSQPPPSIRPPSPTQMGYQTRQSQSLTETSPLQAFGAPQSLPSFPPPTLSTSDSFDNVYRSQPAKLMLHNAVQAQQEQIQRYRNEPPVSIMVTSSSGNDFSKPLSSIYSSDSLPRLPKLDSSSSIKLESLRNSTADTMVYGSAKPTLNWADSAYTAYVQDVPRSPLRSAAAQSLDEEVERMNKDFSSYMSRELR